MRQQYHRVDDDRRPCHRKSMDQLLEQLMASDMANFLEPHPDEAHLLLVCFPDEVDVLQNLDELRRACCRTLVGVHLDESAC
jgi:hypothetical protein